MRLLEANRNSKLSLMGEEPGLCVVSFGTQPVLSLAHKYGLGPQKAAEQLAGLFIYLGADKVTSVTLGENLSLVESQREFLRIYESAKAGDGASKGLPILTGICPGWVCYAEKLHGHSLPYISKVKSPQQIMGALIKLVYGPRKNYSPDQITHITLMSCFDRKLEASRPDFEITEYRTREVDNVITAIEIEQILETLGKSLTEFTPVKLEDLFSPTEMDMTIGYSLMSHYGSGSGGYAEYVLRSMAKYLFGTELDTVVWKQGRNPDIWESVISDRDGKPILRFCIATGFRNIQTIVRKLKTKGLANQLPHYIEIMACPTGCLNGGAQTRSGTETLQPRELSFKLEADYHALALVNEEAAVSEIYDTLGSPDSELYQTVLYTQFHAVEKLAGLGLGVKW